MTNGMIGTNFKTTLLTKQMINDEVYINILNIYGIFN